MCKIVVPTVKGHMTKWKMFWKQKVAFHSKPPSLQHGEAGVPVAVTYGRSSRHSIECLLGPGDEFMEEIVCLEVAIIVLASCIKSIPGNHGSTHIE